MFVIRWDYNGRTLYAGMVTDWCEFNGAGMIQFATLEDATEFAKDYIQEENAFILNTHTGERHSFTYTGY